MQGKGVDEHYFQSAPGQWQPTGKGRTLWNETILAHDLSVTTRSVEGLICKPRGQSAE